MEQDTRPRVNHMEYMEGMEQIDSDIMDKVISARNAYCAEDYTGADVKRALMKDHLEIQDFAALLSPAAEPYIEQMAQKAKQETSKHFGNSVYIQNILTPHTPSMVSIAGAMDIPNPLRYPDIFSYSILNMYAENIITSLR